MKIWGTNKEEEIVLINILDHKWTETYLGNQYISCPKTEIAFRYTGQEVCPECGLRFEIQEILPLPGETRL